MVIYSSLSKKLDDNAFALLKKETDFSSLRS